MPSTPNYNLSYPTVGSDQDSWGGTLNTTIISIDTNLKTVSDAIPTSIVASSITDTPNNFTSSASKFVKVNSSGNAIEFVTASITDLSDTPSSLGSANQILKMNSGGTALEWGTDASGSGGITLTEARNGLSVNQLSPSGNQNSALAYTQSTGQFTFQPPDLSGYASSSNGTAVRSGYVQGYVSNTAFNVVGTYIWASGTIGNTSTEYYNGQDVSGSSIYPAGAISYDSGGGNVGIDVSTSAIGTGTWKAMGQIDNLATTASGNYMQHRHTLWLRVI